MRVQAAKNLNNIKMRASNFSLVINAIRENEVISRSDLVDLVGLTSATITNLVNSGIQDGYIIEAGSGNSQGGRKPKLIELNKDAGYIIGIEINANESICILTDFKENIIAKKYLKIENDIDQEALLDRIVEIVKGFLAENNLEPKDIFGTGFATVGPCDHATGVIVNTPNFPKWHNFRIIELYEQKTGIKAYLEKETAAFALHESWNDRQNNYKRIFCVNVFTKGIGGGLALDKAIYHGHKNAGLEIGHMTIQPDGPLCVCGKKGCLEKMADGDAALGYFRQYAKAGVPTGIADIDHADLKTVIAGAEKGDEACARAILKCANYIGTALTSLITIFAPDVIFVGGEFIEESKLLFDETVKKAKERTYPFVDADIEILKSKSGKDSGALGAVALVLNNIFSK
jgi:predicted NBD/HSP70 family sugar kinase